MKSFLWIIKFVSGLKKKLEDEWPLYSNEKGLELGIGSKGSFCNI